MSEQYKSLAERNGALYGELFRLVLAIQREELTEDNTPGLADQFANLCERVVVQLGYTPEDLNKTINNMRDFADNSRS